VHVLADGGPMHCALACCTRGWQGMPGGKSCYVLEVSAPSGSAHDAMAYATADLGALRHLRASLWMKGTSEADTTTTRASPWPSRCSERELDATLKFL
jgi:hypothetical protein